MTPERMREKLAEWRGYPACKCGNASCTSGTKDYPNDLNAIRELERELDEDEMHKYYQEIYWLVEEMRNGMPERPADRYLLHVGPLQRCEALLKTLGLWEEA